MKRSIIPWFGPRITQKKEIIPRGEQGIKQPKRVYYIIFMADPDIPPSGDLNEHMERIGRYLDFLNKLFGQEGFEKAGNGIATWPAFRYEALFVPEEKSEAFAHQLASLHLPMLMLKVEKSTRQEVIEHFRGWRSFSFWTLKKYETLFEFLVGGFTFSSHIENKFIRRKFSSREKGEQCKIKIKWISKAGIECIRLFLGFLEKREKEEETEQSKGLKGGEPPLLKDRF